VRAHAADFGDHIATPHVWGRYDPGIPGVENVEKSITHERSLRYSGKEEVGRSVQQAPHRVAAALRRFANPSMALHIRVTLSLVALCSSR
jgi:hypothetical protein